MKHELSVRVSGKRYVIEREACSKADLPNWVIYLESVKVGSKATESPIDRRSINNPIRVRPC